MLWTKSKSQSIIYLKTLSSVQTRRVPTFFLPLEALNASIDKLAGSLLADSYDWFIIYCALCLNIYLIAIAAKDKGGTNIGHIFLLHYILCPLPVSHVLLQFCFHDAICRNYSLSYCTRWNSLRDTGKKKNVKNHLIFPVIDTPHTIKVSLMENKTYYIWFSECWAGNICIMEKSAASQVSSIELRSDLGLWTLKLRPRTWGQRCKSVIFRLNALLFP